jgi:hypothetical protein
MRPPCPAPRTNCEVNRALCGRPELSWRLYANKQRNPRTPKDVSAAVHAWHCVCLGSRAAVDCWHASCYSQDGKASKASNSNAGVAQWWNLPPNV